MDVAARVLSRPDVWTRVEAASGELLSPLCFAVGAHLTHPDVVARFDEAVEARIAQRAASWDRDEVAEPFQVALLFNAVRDSAEIDRLFAGGMTGRDRVRQVLQHQFRTSSVVNVDGETMQSMLTLPHVSKQSRRTFCEEVLRGGDLHVAFARRPPLSPREWVQAANRANEQSPEHVAFLADALAVHGFAESALAVLTETTGYSKFSALNRALAFALHADDQGPAREVMRQIAHWPGWDGKLDAFEMRVVTSSRLALRNLDDALAHASDGAPLVVRFDSACTARAFVSRDEALIRSVVAEGGPHREARGWQNAEDLFLASTHGGEWLHRTLLREKERIVYNITGLFDCLSLLKMALRVGNRERCCAVFGTVIGIARHLRRLSFLGGPLCVAVMRFAKDESDVAFLSQCLAAHPEIERDLDDRMDPPLRVCLSRTAEIVRVFPLACRARACTWLMNTWLAMHGFGLALEWCLSEFVGMRVTAEEAGAVFAQAKETSVGKSEGTESAFVRAAAQFDRVDILDWALKRWGRKRLFEECHLGYTLFSSAAGHSSLAVLSWAEREGLFAAARCGAPDVIMRRAAAEGALLTLRWARCESARFRRKGTPLPWPRSGCVEAIKHYHFETARWMRDARRPGGKCPWGEVPPEVAERFEGFCTVGGPGEWMFSEDPDPLPRTLRHCSWVLCPKCYVAERGVDADAAEHEADADADAAEHEADDDAGAGGRRADDDADAAGRRADDDAGAGDGHEAE